MLQFFRRYQKIVFFVVTVVVVISFCFFGTYGALSSSEKSADQEIGKGMMGKPLFAREYNALFALLGSSMWDRNHQEGIGNLLNPGIIERDFLATGLGAILVRPYFDKMKQELDARAKRIQKDRPYSHPQSQEVGIEKLFSLFSPSFAPTYRHLKARCDQATMETWMLLSQLYLEQAALPPTEMIRQFLLMQEGQLGLTHDPLLPHVNLSLFGFKSIEDWFGPQFLHLVTSSILQVAQLAEERGYHISNEEVREELFSSIRQGYEKVLRKKEVPFDEVQRYYVSRMHAFGMDEAILLKAWKKVMLFERVFEEVGGSVYLDPLALQQFEEFAHEKREIEVISLPSFLQFQDFLSLCKFGLYLDSVSPEGKEFRRTLQLPHTFYSVEQIEKKVPELISQKIAIEWRSVSMEEMVGKVSLQETLRFQHEHWERLQERFPKLKGKDKSVALDSLPLAERKEVDQFAQEEIVKIAKERIHLALIEKPMTRLSGNLSPGSSLFSRLHLDNKEILTLLQDASFPHEDGNEAARYLRHYTADQKTFYEIVVLERDPIRNVMTFSEALQEGICDRMLEQHLGKMYPDARKKNPTLFQTEEGKFKEPSLVQTEIASVVFSDLVQTISKTPAYLERAGQEDPLKLCAQLCWLPEVQKVHQRVMQQETAFLSFYEKAPVSFVADLGLTRKIETVLRSSPSVFPKEALFQEGLLTWSSVTKGEKGIIGFYRVLQKEQEEVLPLEELGQGHEMLAQDAKRNLMMSLLKKIHQTENIDLLSYAH